jgi:iron complex outermembrane recepter protein
MRTFISPVYVLGGALAVTAATAVSANDAAATESPLSAEPAAAAAESAEPVVELEPVRVTADLWQTPLERLPASVSVYEGGAALSAQGIGHVGDLAAQVPNLTWTGGTARPRFFQIRGIGENSQYEGETPDAAVRFLVDDLDFTGLGGVGATFDTQQVEVLRGPQAGAFGANAAGGVIRLVTVAPSPHWTGGLNSTVSGDGLREVTAAVGGPVIAADPERLMVRVAVQRHESEGFRRNVFLGRDTNARDELFARLRLTWNPGATWRWEATGVAGEQDNGFDEFALDNNGRRTFSDEPGEDDQRTLAGGLRGVYSGSEDVVFTTISQVGRAETLYSYDSDWASDYSHPFAYQSFAALERARDTLSQELRLDSAAEEDALGWIDRWTLGAQVARLDEGSFFSTTGGARAGGDYRADSTSVYGQAAHDFSARTRLTLGLRAEAVRQRGAVAGDVGDGPVRYADTFSDTLGGGKVTLEHELSSKVRAYASTARGYKAGGVALDPYVAPGAAAPGFASEALWNHELGLKARGWDDRVTGELTAFYLQRHDTQLRGSVGATDSFRYYTINGGEAWVRGLESTLGVTLGAGWSVQASLGLMESEREAFTRPDGSTAEARELAATPEHGYSVELIYQAREGWFGRVGVVGRAAYFETEGSDEQRDAYAVLNAAFGYARGGWTASVWVRNVLDETYAKRVFNFGNDPALDYAPTRYTSQADPRQVGVSVGWGF